MAVFISKTVKTNEDWLEVFPIGDSHKGDETHTDAGADKLQGYINYVLEEKHRYTILLGDLMNGNTSMGPGKPVDDILGYDEQTRHIYEQYLPLFEQDRVLAIIRGNHEDKGERQMQAKHDPMAQLAYFWGQAVDQDVEALYGGYEALIDLNVRGKRSTGSRGGIRYVWYVHHGASGATSDGGKLNAVKRLRNNADADIYLMGHVHKPLATFDDEMAVSSKGLPYMRRRFYCINGAMLSRIPDWNSPSTSYAAKKAYSPVPMRYLKISLNTKVDIRKQIRVTT